MDLILGDTRGGIIGSHKRDAYTLKKNNFTAVKRGTNGGDRRGGTDGLRLLVCETDYISPSEKGTSRGF